MIADLYLANVQKIFFELRKKIKQNNIREVIYCTTLHVYMSACILYYYILKFINHNNDTRKLYWY